MATELVTITPISLTAGTSIALSQTELFVSSVLIEADATNGTNIYIGASGVTTTNGHCLAAKQAMEISFDTVYGVNGKINLAEIRAAADTTGNKVRATYQTWQGG